MESLTRVTVAALLAAFAVLSPACSSGGADTPEDIARMAFEALKEGSTKPLEGCLPTGSDIEELLETIREKGEKGDYEESRRSIDKLGGPEKHAEETADNVRNGLERIRKKLAESSPPIDWSKAEFGGLDEEQTRIRDEMGLKQADIFFRVKVGEVTHTIMLDDCIKADRGWLCDGGIRLIGAGLKARDPDREAPPPSW